MGNYAVIAVVKTDDNKFTLNATKIESELKHHPRKKRPKRKMPNFGHPILRDIKKGRVHATVEGAMGELERLHEEFPEISIPARGKLYIMIYAQAKNPKERVKKYVIEIEAQNDGGFKLILKPNDYEKKELPHQKKAAEQAQEQNAPTGKFTSMVALRRVKKGKPLKPTAPVGTESSE